MRAGDTGLQERLERELGQLFLTALMPIVVLRSNGEIVAANGAAIAQYGFSASELVSKSIQDLLVTPRDTVREINAALEGRGATLTRRRHQRRDGTIVSVLPSAFPLTVLGETLLVSFLQDVTSIDLAEEREQSAREQARELEARSTALRAELLAADRLASIGRVAAGIAHEVNNPAALVTVNLGTLKDRLQSARPRIEEALSMIDDSLIAMERIRDIVRQVRGFSRERPSERVDLSRLAATVIRMVQFDAQTPATVEASFEPEVFARVRGSRVSQVLTNLLINAAQAMPEPPAHPGPAGREGEPHIVLRTFREGAEACIEVADSGPGVPAHLAHRIFEPFFTTRERSGGTGLGLWLARGIIEEEGGTLALAERPGGGAVFRVSLPAATA